MTVEELRKKLEHYGGGRRVMIMTDEGPGDIVKFELNEDGDVIIHDR
jgi:hypothetical protein